MRGDVVKITIRTGKRYFSKNTSVQPDMSIQVTAVNIAFNKPHRLGGYGGQHARRAIADGAEAGNVKNASTNRTAPAT